MYGPSDSGAQHVDYSSGSPNCRLLVEGSGDSRPSPSRGDSPPEAPGPAEPAPGAPPCSPSPRGGEGIGCGSGSGTIVSVSASGAGPSAEAAAVRALGVRRVRDQTIAKALQCRPRGLLLSLLLGRPMPGAERLRSREDHGCVLALVAHARTFAVVERGRSETLLRHLLQAAFEVLVLGGGRQRSVAVEVVVIGGVVAGIQKHSAKHGLERIREQRLQTSTAALGDALAQVEVAAEVELLGHLGQRVGVDHRRTSLCQLALGRARVVLVQVLGGDQLQDGVAEILEPFVVTRRLMRALVRERAMGDRLE